MLDAPGLESHGSGHVRGSRAAAPLAESALEVESREYGDQEKVRTAVDQQRELSR